MIAPQVTAGGVVDLLNPDMPADAVRLHMGEMTAQEMRTARAAIGWANAKAAALIEAAEAREKVLREAIDKIADFDDADAGLDLNVVHLIRIAGAARRTALGGQDAG